MILSPLAAQSKKVTDCIINLIQRHFPAPMFQRTVHTKMLKAGGVAAFCCFVNILLAEVPQYPVQRPERRVPPPADSVFIVSPDQPRQCIKGFGFEIQSDSIVSGNDGLPVATTSVPHDLVPAERERNSAKLRAS